MALTFASSYVFTDFQTSNESGISVAKEYQSAAQWRGCTFVPVVLDCQGVENERRMLSPERLNLVAGGKGMLIDSDILHKFRKRAEIYAFDCPESLRLDVTKLSSKEAARRILMHVELLISRGWTSTS